MVDVVNVDKEPSIKKVQYLIVVDGASYYDLYRLMFHEIYSLDNVDIFSDQKKDNWLKKILLKDSVQKLIKGRFDVIVNDKNKVYEEISYWENKVNEVCVIFTNAALFYNRYLVGTLKQYKKKWSNLKMVLLYLDIVGTGVCKNANYLREHGVFDKVLTIEKDDAKNIGAELVWSPYSIVEEYKKIMPTYDLYFCGASKGRVELLTQIAMCCEENDVNYKMDVVAGDEVEEMQKNVKNIRFWPTGHYRKYSEVLTDSLQATCIVEIVQEKQSALTIRPYEAVIYGRKFLTNNKTILDFPYYDKRYMCYFEKIDEIDWEWLKRKEEVDYGYKGEFSPIHLLEKI